MKRKRKTEQMSTLKLGEVGGRGRGGRVLRNRIIIHEEVVVEAREEVGRRGVGERVPKSRKRQKKVVTEAREEVGDVGGRGAGGRVLRNRKRQEEVVTEAREEVGDVGGRGAGRRVLRNRKKTEAREEVGDVGGRGAGGRVLRNRKRLEEVVTEAREEVGQVGGGGRGRRVVRKRQEEVVIEARKEVGQAGGGGLGGRGLGGRVIRKRKRDEEVVIEAREEEGSHQAQPMGEEEEAQSEAWEEADIVGPIVCRGRGRGQRQREVEVGREEGEDDDDDLQSEAGEDDDVQAEVDAEDDDVQSEVDAEDDELQVESQEEAESQAESQEGDEESRAESQEGDEESQVESQEDDEESQVESQEDDEESDSGDEDDADDGPWVGPQDRSLLKDFRNHVAASISGGTERKLLKLYNHSRLLRKWELPKTNRRFMEKVTASGLLALAEITYKYSNYVLVSSFVERWHPETNSFHFRFGEMTITLDDVPYLIGVPVEGLAVHTEVHGKEDCVALLRRTLGVTKRNAKAAVFCGGVTFDWLWNNFGELEDDATDDRVDYCVRAYLLYLLGTTLFVDKTGVRVNVSYLALLSDLRLVSTYGWGVGALGFLYRQLGQTSRCHVKGMGGYITLLEAWIQEHFPMFRHAMNPNYTGDLPRAARWQSRREAKSATTVRYRVMLDDVQASQVVFDPYRECRPVVADIVFYTGCICCMTVVEPYLPDRVLRQFGLVQFVPGPPLAPLRGSRGSTAATYSVVYQYTDALWQNWRDHLLHEDKRVPVRAGVPWESHHDYLPWFRTVSHFRVAPTRGEGWQESQSVEERNAAALAFLDNFLGGGTVPTVPCDMWNTILQVRRILSGTEAGHPGTPAPT